MQTAIPDPIVGRVLEGRYRIRQRLARGGMSTVYTAIDERLDREVAVKVMSSALSTDPAFADRFTREARVAARLSHPNAVSVFDQGTDGGHVFLVMELVRGRTLRELLRERGALSPALAVSIMEPVLGALAAAHRAGLVHRDVKPENILLSDDGAVKVADFGLARAIEADVGSTRTGLMMGTVAYCPPEQISRGLADARSDVYSAGIVLFELLTGSAPYVGDSAMSVAYQHVNSEVPLPSSRHGGIPTALDEVVLRATSREPSGRPLDAGAFLAELHDVRLDLALPVVGVPARPRGDADPHATQVIPAVHGAVAPGGRHSAEAATAPTNGASSHRGPGATAVTQRPGAGGRGAPPLPPIGRAAAAGAPLSHEDARRRANLERRRKARMRTTIVVLVILLLGLATGYGAWWFAVGRYRTVPDVTGMSQQSATSQLRGKGFAVASAVRTQFSETVAAGQVISTDPGADSHLLKGRSITLVVSKGAERFTVPDVTGKSLADAQKALAAIPVQLVPSQAADPTGKISEGDVISTDPPTGTAVKRNQLVKIIVSSGPPIVAVPDVRNKPKADAEKTLNGKGFKVSFTEDFSDTVPAGTVISTNPAQSESAVKFSTVSVVVSKGPEFVTIPDIRKGDDPNDATAQLESLGLKVDIVKKGKSLFDFSGYTVDKVDPGPGMSVRVGSTVVLTLK